jgi:putative transposase
MFGKLKDRRRIAMRYDRCAHTFTSAIGDSWLIGFWGAERR